MEVNERPSGSERGGRRRRRRRRRGGRKGNSQQQNQLLRLDPDDCRNRGGNQSGRAKIEGANELNPFNLFCAYHLGVTNDNGYKFQSISDLARRFGVSTAVVKDRLQRYGMQTEELKKIGFDGSIFQMDIKVAPPGVSKVEIARSIWEEFVDQIDIQPDPEPSEEVEAEETGDSKAEADKEAADSSEEVSAEAEAKTDDTDESEEVSADADAEESE